MPDVLFHNIDGIVEDLVNGQRDSAVNGLDRLLCGVRFLCNEQFERVERDRHVPRENLQELQVAFRKRSWLRAFNVKRTDYLIVQNERYGQRAFCASEPLDIERILLSILT